MNYLAVGPYCWGKGISREEAVRNAAKNWPRTSLKVKRPRDQHFSIYISEGDFEVDGLGGVSSTQVIEKIQTSVLASGG